MAWNLRPMVTPSSSRPVARFTLDLPPATELTGLSRRALALSPTGAHLAFVADDQLWLRSLDETESRPVPESEGAQAPFFSPDGRWVGFWAAGELRKAAVTGGAPQTLSQIPSMASASWAADDTILLSRAQGVWRVSADGGEPELAVAVSEEEFASGPSLLPDGETVLLTLANPSSQGRTWDDARIVAVRVGDGEPTVIVEGGTDARYVSTGHLVYARDGAVAVGEETGMGTPRDHRGVGPSIQGQTRRANVGKGHGAAGTGDNQQRPPVYGRDLKAGGGRWSDA